MNKHHTIAPNHLRNTLAEIKAYSEEWSGDEPQEEGVA